MEVLRQDFCFTFQGVMVKVIGVCGFSARQDLVLPRARYEADHLAGPLTFETYFVPPISGIRYTIYSNLSSSLPGVYQFRLNGAGTVTTAPVSVAWEAVPIAKCMCLPTENTF